MKMKNVGPFGFTVILIVAFALILSLSCEVQSYLAVKRFSHECGTPGKVTGLKVTSTCLK